MKIENNNFFNSVVDRLKRIGDGNKSVSESSGEQKQVTDQVTLSGGKCKGCNPSGGSSKGAKPTKPESNVGSPVNGGKTKGSTPSGGSSKGSKPTKPESNVGSPVNGGKTKGSTPSGGGSKGSGIFNNSQGFMVSGENRFPEPNNPFKA